MINAVIWGMFIPVGNTLLCIIFASLTQNQMEGKMQ